MKESSSSNDDPIILFKLKDYTTIIVGRWSTTEGCMYVQRGDGTCYSYGAFGVEYFRILNEEASVSGLDAQRYLNEVLKQRRKGVPILLYPLKDFKAECTGP